MGTNDIGNQIGTTRLRFTPWVALFASLLCAAGAACHPSNAAGPTGSATFAEAGARAHANVVTWSAGDRYTYQVELASTSQVETSSNSVGFRATAALRVHPRQNAGAIAFYAELFDVDVQPSADGATLPPTLMTDLALPWGFEIEDGALHAVRARGNLSPFAIGILTTLASGLQSPVAAADTGVWEHPEADASGTYHAQYRAGPEADTLTRTKTAYDSRTLPGPKLPFGQFKDAPSILASDGVFRIRGVDLFALRSHEELEAALSALSKVRSTTDLSLKLVDHAPDAQPPNWVALLESTVSTAPGVLAAQPEVDAYDLKIAETLTFPQALAQAEKESTPAPGASGDPMDLPPADEAQAGERQHAFTNLVALLRTRPGTVALATAAIDRRSPARLMLVDALGSAATPDSLAALATYARRPKPEDVRKKAAFALVRTPRPNAASVDVLVGFLDDPFLRPYAIMGLGAYSRRLRRAGQIDVANRAADAILPLLDTPTLTERVDVLRGIANSGDGRAFGRVRPLLDDANESVRAAAVDAIRLMPNPEVDGLIAARMAPGEPLAVRLAAIDAARLRGAHDPVLSAVQNAALQSQDSDSRLRAVMLLRRWIPDAPGVRATLEQVARADSREAVRRAAKAALGT